jgi:hypothetical protein
MDRPAASHAIYPRTPVSVDIEKLEMNTSYKVLEEKMDAKKNARP